jgi:vacuolar-type H+-ATPase subunit F/Vma7
MAIGILADRQTIQGFRLAGVTHAHELTHASFEEAAKAFHALRNEKGLAMIIITQRIASLIRTELTETLQENPVPAIVEIPERKGSAKGVTLIEAITSKALGTKTEIETNE